MKLIPHPLSAILAGGKPAPLQAMLALGAVMVQDYRIGLRRRGPGPL
jgi:hypothetical protein